MCILRFKLGHFVIRLKHFRSTRTISAILRSIYSRGRRYGRREGGLVSGISSPLNFINEFVDIVFLPDLYFFYIIGNLVFLFRINFCIDPVVVLFAILNAVWNWKAITTVCKTMLKVIY